LKATKHIARVDECKPLPRRKRIAGRSLHAQHDQIMNEWTVSVREGGDITWPRLSSALSHSGSGLSTGQDLRTRPFLDRKAKLTRLSARVDAQQHALSDVDTRLAQIDGAIAEVTKRGRTNGALDPIQHKARAELLAKRQREANVLTGLKTEQAAAAAQAHQVEVRRSCMWLSCSAARRSRPSAG
jgi:hypothetical protein